ncbi:histidine kinase [Sulfurifustis variabilis]|uniref:histidine kinase n=1 Tax=Sulfurifustis variabilis TaxID=1675686 RepID=A0A1B4VB78_9GAMM|nr:PAS domain-containing protein [Sulfurifustis variabilis]BAU47641.1 histidine kinase [Sulfurifustis variabilis]
MSLPDGRYQYLSTGCTELTGHAPEDFYARPLLVKEILHPGSRAYFEAAWEALLRGEMPPSYEYAIVDRSGRTRWLRQQNVLVRDEKGRPIAIEGVVSEFTDLKCLQAELESAVRDRTESLESANRRLREEVALHQQALSELRDSEAQLRLLTDHLPAAISYVDAGERYRFNNSTYEDWFGRTQAEVRGKSVREVVGDAAYALIADKIRTALSGEAVTFEAALPYARGGTRFVRASYVPHRDEHRGVKGFFVLVSDISDARRIEAAERRHLQELAHAARLASLGEMASELTHELGQPLSAIMNYTETCGLLLERGRIEELRSVAQHLGRQAQRAMEIIHGFRRFLQKGTPEVRPLDPRKTLAAAVALVGWEAEARRVPLKLDVPEGLPAVRADSGLIEQVIVNLLRNALEAIGDRPAEGQDITVTARARGDGVEVLVRDRGSGLSAEARAHLFEPFFTTKRNGVGIGLAVCRRIIESHGGTLWADDNPEGPGAEFHFTLPAAREQKGGRTPPADPAGEL